MKHLILTALMLVSTQMAFAQEDWQAPNALPFVNKACEAQKAAQNVLGRSAENLLSCSTEALTVYASQAFDIADNLATTSSQLLKFRILNKQNFTAEHYAQIEDLELQIDKLVAQFRARGTATILFE